MTHRIDDKMMMQQTERLRIGVTQWKIEALGEHQTRSKRPRTTEKGKRKNRLNGLFKRFLRGMHHRFRYTSETVEIEA